GQVDEAARRALAPFEREAGGDGTGPYGIQHDLQEMMQELVGIVRREEEMARALAGLAKLRERASRARVDGNRAYNPGWHTALDLGPLLTVSEAVARSALERRESRGAHTRVEHPDTDPQLGSVNFVVRRQDGAMAVAREALPRMPDELRRVLEGEV